MIKSVWRRPDAFCLCKKPPVSRRLDCVYSLRMRLTTLPRMVTEGTMIGAMASFSG